MASKIFTYFIHVHFFPMFSFFFLHISWILPLFSCRKSVQKIHEHDEMVPAMEPVHFHLKLHSSESGMSDGGVLSEFAPMLVDIIWLILTNNFHHTTDKWQLILCSRSPEKLFSSLVCCISYKRQHVLNVNSTTFPKIMYEMHVILGDKLICAT